MTIVIRNLEAVLGGARIVFHVYGPTGTTSSVEFYYQLDDKRTPLLALTECAWDDEAPVPGEILRCDHLREPTNGEVDSQYPHILRNVVSEVEGSVIWQTSLAQGTGLALMGKVFF